MSLPILWRDCCLIVDNVEKNSSARRAGKGKPILRFLTPGGGRQPTAQIFLRIGNRQDFHKDFISAYYGPVNATTSDKRQVAP